MKCQACNQEVELPFRCSYCGGGFCSAHRLPENHACPRLEQARAERQGQVMTQQGYGNYSYSYVYGQDPYKKQFHIRWSQKELKHIGIAAALVMGIGISIGVFAILLPQFFGFSFNWTPATMLVFGVVMIFSFLTHEIAHKVTAQKRGLWAEFRLTTFGALVTFASIFLPFRMIAPGAMMIGGTLQKKEDIVTISVAGPITNMLFSVIFLALAFTLPVPVEWFGMLFFSAYINAFMAVFNLVPFGVLDGLKIFDLNKKVWVAAFVPAAILAIFTYLLFV